MVTHTTESRQRDSIGYAHQSPTQMLQLMLQAQCDAAGSVTESLAGIERGARLMAQAIRSGGRLFYCGAGSSGLMALADSLELPGTFGIDAQQIHLLLAGGRQTLSRLGGAADDDTGQADNDIQAHQPGVNDCLVAVSASGNTRYTQRTMTLMKARGVPTIALANNPQSGLLEGADVPILLQTLPELVAGSTRLGAGTAQKIALNMMSTLMASLLGHVYDGHMVNLQADSEKLRQRALRIVADISGCDEHRASACLLTAQNDVKIAILLASGFADVDSASARLEDSNGHIGKALASLGKSLRLWDAKPTL